MLDDYGNRHTHTVRNTNCFPTATLVTQTRLIVHCRSCVAMPVSTSKLKRRCLWRQMRLCSVTQRHCRTRVLGSRSALCSTKKLRFSGVFVHYRGRGFPRSDLRCALVIVLFVAVACWRDINIGKRKIARNRNRQTTVMLRITTFRLTTDRI